MSPTRLHDVARIGAIALALAFVAACSSGPRTPPDTSQRALLEAAASYLATSDHIGPGTLYVLDHLEPALVDRMRDVEGFGAYLADDPPSGALSPEAQDALRRRLGADRSVEFASSADEVPRMGREILGCIPFGDGVTYVEFAPVLLTGGHGDAYVVAVGLSTGCGWRPMAIVLSWKPGTLFGGTWEVRDVFDGPAVVV